VLGTPPAFILSQDQTLIRIFFPNPVSFQILASFGSLRFFLLFSFQRTLKPLIALGFVRQSVFSGSFNIPFLPGGVN
ncbi:hypothetical protein, partial [Anoxynatronum buryatiense]|uniref:hypothetical protein n=1 Tax=Anoxynatronum buryatiense TaxID=489973 RepID=UPI0024B6B9F1